MRFKMCRRKNKVFIRYVMSGEELHLFLPFLTEVRAEDGAHVLVYSFRDEEEAKKVMGFKSFFANIPLAVQQAIPKEKFLEAYLKASGLRGGEA